MTQPTPIEPTTAQPITTRRRSWLFFFVAALLVLAGFELGARYLGPNTSQINRNLDDHRVNLEAIEPSLLFLGDSSAGAAIDPLAFDAATGETSYNLWQPTASTRVLERVLLDYGLGQTDPLAVVIGVTGRMFNGASSDDVFAQQLDLESSLPWQRVVAPSPTTRIEAFAADRSALVRHRSALRRPTDWYRALISDQPFEIDGRGHLTFDESLSVEEIRPAHRDTEQEALAGYVPGDDEFAALARTIEQLNDSGIAVYVVELPVYEEVYHPYYPRGDADVAAFRSRLAADLDGLPAIHIDMTDFTQDPALFSDENHLRPEAARQFSAELARRVDPT